MKRRAAQQSPEILSASRRIGQAIKLARIRRRLTQAQVAERSGLSKQTLSRLERGDPGVAVGNILEVLLVLERGWVEQAAVFLEADEPGRVLADQRLPSKVMPEDF